MSERLTLDVIKTIVPCVEGDRSDCQIPVPVIACSCHKIMLLWYLFVMWPRRKVTYSLIPLFVMRLKTEILETVVSVKLCSVRDSIANPTTSHMGYGDLSHTEVK